MDIPRDKKYPENSVQCDKCGGHGCLPCGERGWFAPREHPLGRHCAYKKCDRPLPPDHEALYDTNKCAFKDAQ